FSPDPITLFIALAFAGSAISFLELGLNVEADAVEKTTGTLIMTKSHGFWSVGIMVGSLIGSALAGLGMSPQLSILTAAVLTLPLGIITGAALPHAEPEPVVETTQEDRKWSLPSPALIGV